MIEEEHIRKVTLNDEYGEVDFYLLPFLKPSYVKTYFGRTASDLWGCCRKTDQVEEIDYHGRRNVLVSHQFYTGNEPPETCDSETFSVGGIDNVDIGAVKDLIMWLWDIWVRRSERGDATYPLLWHAAEIFGQRVWTGKALTLVTLSEGCASQSGAACASSLRDVKRRGEPGGDSEAANEEERDDYVSITLTDEVDPYKPKEQLEEVFDRDSGGKGRQYQDQK